MVVTRTIVTLVLCHAINPTLGDWLLIHIGISRGEFGFFVTPNPFPRIGGRAGALAD
jgi:hypothetical protein